ncbi:MAG TPA: oligoendopeptidase F, partial [Balneolaceae bacterium]|nr:oligoendopeptidase F [Balneolaceae bacterium]
ELLVLALYEEFKQRPDGFADKYLELLSAGGSEWPHDLVAKMGLDIRDPEFWANGLKSFEKMIDEAEQLSGELKNK